MRKQTCALLLLLISHASFAVAQMKTEREKAGLSGKVKTVSLEKSEIREQDGTPVESQHILESVAVYWDAKPADDSFEYDPQGNWTKRSHRRKVTESGKTTEFLEVTYRKITYH